MILSLDAGQIRSSARSSAAGSRYAEAVLRVAGDIHASPLLELEREAGRDVILPTSRKLFDRVATLAVADCLVGGSAFRRRAIRELLNAAAFADWNPPHFLDTAEMTTGMALGLCWTRPLLIRTEHDTIAAAIIEKGLSPGLAAAAAGVPWMTACNNWNIVCCTGMIAGAAAMAGTGHPLARDALACFIPALRHGLSAFGADGGYDEGPDYWEYAVRYAVLAHAVLEDIGPGSEVPAALARTWRYGRDLTGPSGRVFNFGDATERPRRAPVLGWLAGRAGEAAAMAWQHAAPGDPHPFDLLWCAPETEPPPPDDAPSAYEPAGLAVLRAGTTWLVLKGGRNDVNHAHLDLGTFVLEMAGRRFVSELGRENYALPGYFEPERRFGYFRTQAAAHSTLLIDGAPQSTAALARLLGTGREGDRRFAAYAVSDDRWPVGWRRGAVLEGTDTVFIVDELGEEGAATPASTWQLYTEAAAALDGPGALLTLDGAAVTAEILAPDGLAWSFEPAPSPDGESSNAAFGRLFFCVPAAAGTQSVIVRFAAGRPSRWRPAAIADWPLDA
ncbi:heparinase II/III family protein [Shinella sp.]|uniref:heparinase II/III domain-containing protein n=1 Tax=Shinella sp. TaxID=1870904 RepID=UPI00258E19A9|nr:heparinase II/III family protein [Shinella sp.]MCW5707942.1 heparinase II/III family protein [Shinella sp.]